MNRGAYYRIEVPLTKGTRHQIPLKVFVHSFEECEPYVRREFKRKSPKFIDVLKLRTDGSLSTFSRRYFPDMSYKSI